MYRLLLDAICIGFINLSTTERSVAIPVQSIAAVTSRLLVILRDVHDTNARSSAWHLLAMLCDRALNSTAFDFLQAVEESAFVLISATTAAM